MIGLLALLVISIARAADERGWGEYLLLARQGAGCQAVITGIGAGPECRAEYAFRLSGRDYRGAGSGCGMRVGQKVTVTYLVADPSRSCLGSAGERLADDVVAFLFGALSFPPLS